MVDGRIEGSLAWVILGGLAFASLMVKLNYKYIFLVFMEVHSACLEIFVFDTVRYTSLFVLSFVTILLCDDHRLSNVPG